MFERLFLPHSTAIYTIAAFAVAASIFVAMTWRALRMRPPETERFAALPFDTPTPPSRHEPSSDPAR